MIWALVGFLLGLAVPRKLPGGITVTRSPAGSVYIQLCKLRKGEVPRTAELGDGVLVDFGYDGSVVGVEVLGHEGD